jgi:isocitrate dehydrogenase kinase/phosphatase
MAPKFFVVRDWNAMQVLHKKRLRLYKDQVRIIVKVLKESLRKNLDDHGLWEDTKSNYSQIIQNLNEKELAETFFNSVIRKSYPVKGVDKNIMFVYEGYDTCAIHSPEKLYHRYPSDLGLEKIIRTIIQDFDFGVAYMDKEADIQFLVNAVREIILTRYNPQEDTETQVLKSVFYRNKAAYLIGRTYIGGKWMPFIIPFLHGPKGIFVDTLIFDRKIMAHLFSFTRSYYMVQADVPSQLVAFLYSVISHKKIHELYNAIGFNKHGKTEFYRDFLLHLRESKDQFEIAEGIYGMVMTVFTLPSYNIVFKMIKDYFDPPKTMTRQEVRDKYRLVGLHDRVGRMADTHEFEEFHLPLDRIHPSLMDHLRKTVNSLLEITDKELILHHVYIERKMVPLNLYLETCSLEEAKNAVEDYGDAIIQLAQANIFPGDMMTKNFGLTRQKRVVFYDYDEIEFMTDMNFREKPKPETFEQIYSPEPWYDIASNDVFPEDFKRFMIGRPDVREHFINHHQKLFDPKFWQAIQELIKLGEINHPFSYPEEIRFRPHEII